MGWFTIGSGFRGRVRSWKLLRRPLVVLLISLAMLGISCVFLADVPEAYAAGRALDARQICTESAPGPCLRMVPGVLEGPHYRRRGPDTEWSLYRDDRGGGADPVLVFDAGVGSGFVSGERVVALTYGAERVVAVVVGDRTVRTLETGPEGVLFSAGLGLGFAALGTLALAFGLASWQRSGRFIAVDATGWDALPLPLAFVRVLVGAVVIGMLVTVVALFGAPWWLALASPLVAWALWKLREPLSRLPRGSGRHAA